MTQEHLDNFDIYALTYEQGCKGVPKHVQTFPLWKPVRPSNDSEGARSIFISEHATGSVLEK
jgi:hypothetical protein